MNISDIVNVFSVELLMFSKNKMAASPENLFFRESDIEKPWIHRLQLESYFTFLPASVFGNLINASVIAWLFSNLFTNAWMAGLIVVAFSMAGVRLLGWSRFRRHGIVPDGEKRLLTTLHVQAIGNGLIWGGTLLALMLFDGEKSVGFLGMVAAGMSCAGAISFAAIPKASRSFILVISSCVMAGFIMTGSAMAAAAGVMLAIYTFVLLKAVALSFTNFIARILREEELRTAAETVSLLLNEFEENGSDWLWEIDADGRIVAPSSRFAQAAERPLETLDGLAMLDLFGTSSELKILSNHIKHMRSFRDVAVELTISGELRWWSLSGRAVRGENGAPDRMRGVATDVSSTKLAESKVAYLAHYDGLTDLPNRFLFNDTINHAINRRKDGSGIAILSIDLDHFKAVNDTLGHPVGDALLKVVGKRIEACLANDEMVARLGGDEFAVLLPRVVGSDHVTRVAKQIVDSFAEPIEIEGHQLICGTSIGIALSPGDGDTVETLMKHVDLALYEAKANGRNRFVFFEPGMDEAARTRREVELDLRAAIMRDELTLYYQPLVDINTGEPNSYEALLRWNHPTKGLVMPTDFVGVAEETGLIVQLGEWVLRTAIAELANWDEHLSVSVNLSPLQMKSASLVTTIVNALAQNQVNPQRLELEITESVLMEQSEVNLTTLHRLRSLGIRIALDDFGTGYSSLNYLRSFPFDKIKIDRCFVQDVHTREDCQAIIRSITSLATSLGMVTTAEGVEDADQLAQLKLQGCSEVQGFLFSKAVPAGELTNLRSSPVKRAADAAALHFLPSADIPVGRLASRGTRRAA
jgi:diguanylate cyclase (GGDEF)-like protein